MNKSKLLHIRTFFTDKQPVSMPYRHGLCTVLYGVKVALPIKIYTENYLRSHLKNNMDQPVFTVLVTIFFR